MVKGNSFWKELTLPGVSRDGRYVIVPDRPGIGVDLREEKLANFPYQSYRNRGNFGPDDAVAR
jgi:L-alanine-DL-glutamate epimerase-like enolase superfamily enzyme